MKKNDKPPETWIQFGEQLESHIKKVRDPEARHALEMLEAMMISVLEWLTKVMNEVEKEK